MSMNPIETTNPPASELSKTSATPKGAKRKSSRKASTARSSASRTPSSAAGSTGPAEVVFDVQPSPYHPTPPPFLWVDFPQERERLHAPVYAIRLGVGGAEHVEISINGSPWKPCRLTSGYWWFDWSAIPAGRHTLVARMRTPDGRWFRTPSRTCEYRP